jgi:LuxR family maltose regulon positive regulatory protein
LLNVLHSHRQHPLVLLLAPAGFGKTTLAADYARSVCLPAVWLALRPGDEDSRRLFERIREAFDSAYGVNSLPGLGRGLASGADGSRLARLLLPDLARLPSPFVLILDDYHVVQTAEEVQEAMDLLVRGLPSGAQVVIATREPPPLSVDSLVVDERVLVLGPDDLRFTPDEAVALRQQLGGDPANDARAEGWVAGILLGGAPRQLGAADGSLVDVYVQREILARLPPASRRWLEAMALLEPITPDGAARLLGPGPWPARLAALADRCPFLIADASGSYRLHALVRDALARCVRRGSPSRARRLWTAVRALAEETGDTATAVQACNEMGEVEAAVALVCRTVDDAIRAGRWTPALGAMALLPESVRRRRPDLALAEAHALVQSGRPAEARQLAEAVLELAGRTGSVSVQVRALVELGNVARYTGEVDAALDWLAAADHLLRGAGLPDRDRRLLEGRLLGLRGVCAAVSGQVDVAREALESAARVLLHEGTTRELAVVEFNLGTLCVRTGDYRSARTALASSSANWRILRDRGMLATAQLILANLQLRTGDLNAAAASVGRAIDAARLAGALRTEAHGLTTLGALQRSYGRLA